MERAERNLIPSLIVSADNHGCRYLSNRIPRNFRFIYDNVKITFYIIDIKFFLSYIS